MSLISPSPHNIHFSRNMTMWDTLIPDVGQALHDDKNVKSWFNALQKDPIVKLGTFIVQESSFYASTALSAGASILNTIIKPITYPLSLILKPEKPQITPFPFKTSIVNDVTKGELVLYKGSIMNNARLALINIGNMFKSAKSPTIRNVYSAASNIISYPIQRLSEPSKENLVLMSIRGYFPDFQIGGFRDWLNDSFIPTVMDGYLNGYQNKYLSNYCLSSCLSERNMQLDEFRMSGLVIKSRFLSIHDFDIIEYNFHNRSPTVTVRFSADHTFDIRTFRGGTIVMGGPNQIYKTDYILTLIITRDLKGQPTWKVMEIHKGQETHRI